ncbi:hypothetical protein BHE74_00039561 [Ensete ventricosum]|nr:hypothetical protein GW17_00045890 [Ensete ventricosum]RWW53896.1 hypothetical protein BHE74_00039561 [Ensete ventricosum]RZS00329.1 hypothetical protein BHM03_00030010 [Ensete ventricosum]
MAVERQGDAKNATLLPSVRTLTDSKLGVDLYKGSVSWNSHPIYSITGLS